MSDVKPKPGESSVSDEIAAVNAYAKSLTYTPKPGERWRVTIEGMVSETTGRWVDIGSHTLRTDEDIWERLPDPEPEWAPGDLVLAADGQVWVRTKTVDWYRPHDPEWFAPDGYPLRPLRRLVPEGDKS